MAVGRLIRGTGTPDFVDMDLACIKDDLIGDKETVA